jgi:hypothetical protein
MKLQSFRYTQGVGWSVTPFPAMDSKQTLVLVFGAPEFIDTTEPINQLVKAYPNSYIVGCSTAGEILGTALMDHSLAVSVVQFEHSRIAVASARVQKPTDSFNAGRALGTALKGPDLRGVLILSDGSLVNGTELVFGLNLHGGIAVTGGLAGDGTRFQKTWVIADGKPQSGVVVGVGFYGNQVAIGFGSQGGWERSGAEWVVTRSQDNMLYELGGKPALEVYKAAIGEHAKGLPASALLFPLALRADASDDKPIVRTILSVDEAKQSMTFAGDMPEGYLAQLMSADLDRLIDSASKAAVMAHGATANGSSDTLCVAISCVGRRLVLGNRTEEELAAVLKTLPTRTQQVGFYSYGEISPSGGFCDLHNQTMTITTISETVPVPA